MNAHPELIPTRNEPVALTAVPVSRLVGEYVFVLPGEYRTPGRGRVVCDRGYGKLRLLEVRLLDKNQKGIQVVGLEEVEVDF